MSKTTQAVIFGVAMLVVAAISESSNRRARHEGVIGRVTEPRASTTSHARAVLPRP